MCSEVELEEMESFISIVLERLEGLDEEEESDGCPHEYELCGRVMKLTRHHLIPRAVHSRLKAKGHSKDELCRCAMICRTCHNAVHHFFTEKELAQHYNTIEKLLQTEPIQRHVAWASTAPVRGTRGQKP